jgi:hypothetical protein
MAAILLNDGLAVVRRPAVDNNELKIAAGLDDNAIDGIS